MKKVVLTVLLFGLCHSVSAADHVVEAAGMKFDPMFLIVEPGDTVTWKNMPAHMIESIDEFVPEGQPKLVSEMGKTVSFTFDVEGVLAYKCTPHWGARMGGMILVGRPDDVSGTLDKYLEIAKNTGPLKPAKGLIKKFRKMLTKEGVL